MGVILFCVALGVVSGTEVLVKHPDLPSDVYLDRSQPHGTHIRRALDDSVLNAIRAETNIPELHNSVLELETQQSSLVSGRSSRVATQPGTLGFASLLFGQLSTFLSRCPT